MIYVDIAGPGQVNSRFSHHEESARTMFGNVACISFMKTSTNSSHLSSGRRRCLMPRSASRASTLVAVIPQASNRASKEVLTQRVGQKLLVVGTKVEGDGESLVMSLGIVSPSDSRKRPSWAGMRARRRWTDRFGVDTARGDVER